jgi:radical SAM superfamily enzyme YgiQ (UPF0313 family)
MSSVKFLLIHPASARARMLRGHPRPTDRIFQQSVLSCLYVAAATPSYVQTRIVDEDVEAIDFGADVDLVGLSFMTLSAPRAYEIADRFRTERGIPVIMGGFHPTVLPEDAAPHADAICIGDAENKMARIMEDYLGGRLQPVYDGTPPDLAEVPVPNRHLLSRFRHAPIDTILATRGCPYGCTFCSITAFHRHTYRMRPVEHVVEELKTLRRRVLFVDDNLIVNRDYAIELFAAIAPLKKKWYSQCSTSIARDDELLRRAAASGCRGMFVGFESLSVPNLEAWRKGFNCPRTYRHVVRKLHNAGIAVFAGIVFGMDDDTPAVFRRTLEFLDDAGVDFAAANVLTPFPGTPLYDEMQRAGRIFDHDWRKYDFNHVVFQPRHMSVETLQRGTYWVRAQFYRRKAVTRRIVQSLGYLDPGTVLHAVVPLNVGFRSRMARSGTMQSGLQYTPPGADG